MSTRLLPALLLGALSVAAHAADPTATIVSTTGTTFAEYSTTATAVGTGLVNQNVLYFIDEQTGALGKSWYVFFEPNGATKISATITFDSAITGLFTTRSALDGSNAAYGAPGYHYGTSAAIGLEAAPQDSFSVTGNTLTLNIIANNPGDHIRVFTSPVPEPGTWALMAGGLLAMGAVARRRRA